VSAIAYIKRYFPKPLLAAYRNYFRWQIERKYTKSIQSSLQHIVNAGGFVVQGGPFKGMRYIEKSTGSALTPKLIGSYEEELHEAMRGISDCPYEVIVDVGCAEGYYAVGLARLYPNALVYAYDTDKESRASCSRMAAINRVERRVILSDWCDPGELASKINNKRALIVCDCEGYEMELLQPELVEGLRQSDIVVELHDHLNRKITPSLLQRFNHTHHIELIRSRDRNSDRYPVLHGLSAKDKDAAVGEWRSIPQEWAVMRVKQLEP
jgi:hypothetical protein